MAAKEETLESFQAMTNDLVISGFKLVGIGLGEKLGLFRAFDGTMTSGELAEKVRCKERYVREWLHQMVLCDVVVVDQTGTKFSLPAHRQQLLTGDASLINIMGPAFMSLLTPHQEILECFRLDGPDGLPFKKVYPFFAERASVNHKSLAMCADFIRDKVSGLKEKLETGIRVCEIGCGNGAMLVHLAGQFPKSNFIGVDLSPDLLAQAKSTLATSKNENVQLLLQDATNFPKDWDNSVDTVVIRDVLHDISHASKALASFYRILKPGGQVAIFEVNLSSNPYQSLQNPDQKLIGQMAYCISTYHCLPASLSVPGSEGLGAGSGIEHIRGLIEKAGFVLEDDLSSGDYFNVMFIGHKPAEKK